MGEVIGCSRQVFSFWKNTTGHGTAEAKLLPLRHLRPASTGVSGTHYSNSYPSNFVWSSFLSIFMAGGMCIVSP